MRRLRWVPLAALVLGAIEFLILVWLAKLTGVGPAVLGVVLLSLLGGILLRAEGMRAWRQLRAARRTGGPDAPVGNNVLDGVIGLSAALLLLLPGYLTGLVGLLLWLPPVRKPARAGLRRATERRVPSHVAGDLFGPRVVRADRGARTRPQRPEDDVVEGEIVD